MPIDLRMLDRDGSDLYREWNKVVKKHNGYLVKNAYHKKRDMEGWNNKLKEINEHYRKMLKAHEEKMAKEQKELEKKKKEEEKVMKELHEKEKKMAEIKRKLKKEKKAKELKSQKLRRSSRLAAKTKRRRCPNGTRRNKKTDNCEKKK